MLSIGTREEKIGVKPPVDAVLLFLNKSNYIYNSDDIFFQIYLGLGK